MNLEKLFGKIRRDYGTMPICELLRNNGWEIQSDDGNGNYLIRRRCGRGFTVAAVEVFDDGINIGNSDSMMAGWRN